MKEASRKRREGRSESARVIRELAHFRYQLRKFLCFSERAARGAGVTPQQHQLMLGVAGFTGRGSASITELAEFLQERHHAVVELVSRASRTGLVRKKASARDQRVVCVELTPKGRAVLTGLSALHRKELERVKTAARRRARGSRRSRRMAKTKA